MKQIRVTVWNENVHERRDEAVQKVYPDGIHGVIAGFLEKDPSIKVRVATLDMPSHGLTDEVLDETDVLVWWGHIAHEQVDDAIVEKVYHRILCGMGFIPLHAAHWSKLFVKLMGTTCRLRWREAAERERIWIVEPSHPIAEGLDEYFELEPEEMYGEKFDVPAPDELIMLGWFQGGEVFRSGCCYRRGYGKIFYFQPGHETYPTFYDPNIQKVITNAVHWAAPCNRVSEILHRNPEPLEPLG